MIEPKQFPLCDKYVDKLIKKFNDNGWVALCSQTIFSCLVSDEAIGKCMASDGWDLIPSDSGPLINEMSDGSFISYSPLQDSGIQPIVRFMESEGRWKDEVFLADEFVMFFKLHKESKGDGQHVYYQVDECGEDVEVARINNPNVEVRLKYVKEYIAVQQLNLLIFIDEMRSAEQSLKEMGCCERPLSIIKDTDIIFSYWLQDYDSIGSHVKANARIMGKCVYRHDPNDIKHLWRLRDSGYEQFIVGADSDGEDVYMSCDPNAIPNLFTRKGDEYYSLSPVFFKRDVLTKYVHSIEKYTVQDGYISGPTWAMRIDNDRQDEYIVVALVDLGKIPHKEQLHWKAYNVLPPKNGDYSDTTYLRWFAAVPTDCAIAPDLVFKQLYKEVNEKWTKKYGWSLYKELAHDDQYHFESLHLMGQTDDQKEFDGLIQSIAKLAIESLDEKHLVDAINRTKPEVEQFLKDKQVPDANPSNINGGISKFECFLVSEGYEYSDYIKILRNIQDLRSYTVAHKRSTNPNNRAKKVFDDLGVNKDSDQVVFSNLLSNLNKMLKWLISIVE